MSTQKNQPDPRPEIDAQINENLKRAFDQVAAEPLPERFSALLDQLRGSGKAQPHE
jgi:hypothetical protein